MGARGLPEKPFGTIPLTCSQAGFTLLDPEERQRALTGGQRGVGKQQRQGGDEGDPSSSI